MSFNPSDGGASQWLDEQSVENTADACVYPTDSCDEEKFSYV